MFGCKSTISLFFSDFISNKHRIVMFVALESEMLK